jgi:hypothetical protein
MTNNLLAPLLNGSHRLPRGRPRNSDDLIKRETQIRWIALVLAGAASVKEAAFANQVTRRTILNWKTSLLGDGEDDTSALRDLANSRD